MPQDRKMPRVYKTILAEVDVPCSRSNLQLQLRTEVFKKNNLENAVLTFILICATVKLCFTAGDTN